MARDTGGRRRAPGMSQEDRRAMIVAVALPLVAEHGTAISTAQVARAAGIGEATLFRAFGDKEALIGACVAAALRPDAALDAIAAIPPDLPLANRLVEAAGELEAHLTRMGAVIGALHTTGGAGRRPAPGAPGTPAADARASSSRAMVEAVAGLFDGVSGLRLPAEQLAAVFLGQLLARSRPLPGAELAVDQVVELFLHGAVAEVAT